MKFLSLVKGPDIPMDQVPPGMFEAMDRFIAEQTRKGHFIGGGGLQRASQSFRVTLRGGKVTITDGPFAEAKEVIGGYAMLAYESREAAIAGAKEFMEFHITHWPGWEGTSEVYPIANEVDAPT